VSQQIEDQIKAAERDKLLLEAEKLKAEKEKILNEARALERDYNKRWWQKGESWKPVFAIFIGIGALSFYIIYVVEPLSDIKNKQNIIKGLNDEIAYTRITLIHEKYVDSVYNLQRIGSQHSFQKSYDSSLLRLSSKQPAANPVPKISGTWLSSLYNGQESWEISPSGETNSFKAILTTPDGVGDGLAIYNGKGAFSITVNFQGKKRVMSLEYSWIANDVNPNAINSTLIVLKSDDPQTPVGTKQSDILIKKIF